MQASFELEELKKSPPLLRLWRHVILLVKPNSFVIGTAERLPQNPRKIDVRIGQLRRVLGTT